MTIQLLDDREVPELIEGLPDTAIAFSYDGKQKSMLAQTEEVLSHFMGADSANDVGMKFSEGNTQTQDSWEKFPEVGAAIKETNPTNECFCIVAAPDHGM